MGSLQFGAAYRDITPRYPIWAHGYSARTRKSSGIRERLSLGCLAASDGSRKVLLVTLDMIGVKVEVCRELYARIEKETGVGFPNVMVASSHTHFAPALHGTAFTDPSIAFVEADPQYVVEVKTKLVETAREALDSLRPMRIETVRATAPQVVYNRRTVRKSDGKVQMNLLYPQDPSPYSFSPVDPELTVHRFVDEAGIQAVLTNFGCHPVTGCSPDEDNYKYSSDYPYYLRQTISGKWHCPVFFTLGSAGDAVPMNRREDSRERIGNVLGNTAVLAERTYTSDPSTALGADTLLVEAETILKTDPASAVSEYEEARKAVLAVEDRKSDPYRKLAAVFDEKMRALGRARLYPENRFSIPVQFLRISGTVWIGLPFEVLSEISLKMKARFPNTVLVSCAGGYQGYLPFAYEYDRGGYEASASSTHFAPGTADRLLEAILKWLENHPV